MTLYRDLIEAIGLDPEGDLKIRAINIRVEMCEPVAVEVEGFIRNEGKLTTVLKKFSLGVPDDQD